MKSLHSFNVKFQILIKQTCSERNYKNIEVQMKQLQLNSNQKSMQCRKCLNKPRNISKKNSKLSLKLFYTFKENQKKGLKPKIYPEELMKVLRYLTAWQRCIVNPWIRIGELVIRNYQFNTELKQLNFNRETNRLDQEELLWPRFGWYLTCEHSIPN